MSPDSIFRIAIQSQGRSPLLLVGTVVAAILLGAALGWLGRSAGIADKITYTFPLVLGLGVATFGIWSSVAPQGWITLTADSLIVEPLMRSDRVWRRSSSDPRLRAWQLRTSGVTQTAGPLLEFRGQGRSFSVGAHDPDLGRRLPTPEGLTLLVPPDFLVAREDFEALLDELAIEVRAG